VNVRAMCDMAGYRWTDIAGCVQWMSAFASVLADEGSAPVKFCDRVTPAEAHTLQTHVVSIKTVVSERSNYILHLTSGGGLCGLIVERSLAILKVAGSNLGRSASR